jgi:phytoene dehydrogenase-like protein
MNGYETHIFEMHDKPGGLCTSWKRKGFVFDGCIHWLVGSREGSDFNRIWMELGALQGKEIVDHDEFLRVEDDQGKTLVIYTDVDRLERHMKELSPEDAEVIEELTGAIRRLADVNVPLDRPSGLSGLVEAVSMLPGLLPVAKYFLKWGKVSTQAYATRFRDPFLRESFSALLGLPDFPLIALVMTLAWMHRRDAGYPVGGSLEFSRAIEKRFRDLGGEITYKAGVEEILVEDDRAVGVRLEDGSEHRAGTVVSAADGHATIFEMLSEKYIDQTIRGYYATMPVFKPLIQVSVGVDRDLSSEPHSVDFELEEPVMIAGRVLDRMNLRHFCYDPTLAPPGKSVVISNIESDYDYWKFLESDKKKYEAEKQGIAEQVIAQLEKRMPGTGEQVEVVDVATPVTYERFTGNWQGSFEGWLPTTRTSRFMMKGMRKTLPGLGDFYMAGHWVKPGGGLPTAAMAGREVVQEICKRDGRSFEAGLP